VGKKAQALNVTAGGDVVIIEPLVVKEDSVKVSSVLM
jgi:virulence-associated protein VagC